MLTNHLDLNLPNQALSKPKPALQASAFSTYCLLEAMLHLILCSCCLYDHSVSLFSSSQSLPIPVSLSLGLYRHHSEYMFVLRICFTSEGYIWVANICSITVFITVILALNMDCGQHHGFMFQFLRDLVFRAELHEACSSNCVMWTQYNVQRWSHLLTVLMYSYEKSF